MTFKVWEIVAHSGNGDRFYGICGDLKEDYSLLEPFMEGDINFSGCMNFSFPRDEKDNCDIHFCGLQICKNFYDLCQKLYGLAIDFMPEATPYLT
jgi:hypothetical protein